MKIDSRFDTSLTATQASSIASAPTSSFRELFEMAKTQGTSAAPASTSLTASTGKTETAYQTAVRELHEYLQKTPEQRMREAILKQMGLSEDDIAKMPPEQQNAIEAAIKEKVKEKLLEQAQDNGNTASARLTAAGNGELKLPMF